jgi:Uma2 family endonuclease
MTPATDSDLTPRRFKRIEYQRLIELGFFGGERLELLDGLLVVREPHNTPQATAIRLAVDALRAAFGAGWRVDSQLPVALDDDSEPEPDVFVVPADARAFRTEHPSTPVLVVEVADASLTLDRRFKAHLYARARLSDYWIVNLVEGVVEVHREAVLSESSPYGWRYASVVIARPGNVLTPFAAPHARVAVADLLP